MNLHRLIRRAVWQWEAWRSRKRLHRELPALADLDRRRAACRRSHKRGAAALERQARQIMTAALTGQQTGGA